MTDVLVFSEAQETNRLLKLICQRLDSIDEKLARLTESENPDEEQKQQFFEPEK